MSVPILEPVVAAPAWPPHRHETRPWRQPASVGTRADRSLTEITVALPPMIAARDVVLDPARAAELDAATREVAALDRDGAGLAALGVLLLRTEAVASYRTEDGDGGLDDYGRALHDAPSGRPAAAMAVATAALDELVGDVTSRGRIEVAALVRAHRRLLAGDPAEGAYAGVVRDVQGWVDRGGDSPRNARYVPPPPETLPGYLADLVAFANRDDLPPLAQAAVAHAQFESVHPFTDGNGRLGRALVNLVLRRRGVTTRVVVPLASALVVHRRRHYFDTLRAYTRGELEPLLADFAAAARTAAAESRVTATRLAGLPAAWRDQVGGVRPGGVVATLLDALPAWPFLSADDAASLTGAPRAGALAAIDRLQVAGVLRPVAADHRNPVWAAAAILGELADLDARIARAAAAGA